MTPAAWIMLIITWSIIVYFTAKFFWKVLKTPHALKTEEQIEEHLDDEQQEMP
ncbi:MAG: hypothetical protein LLG40_04940 [Deltaproteobacteria bacterium]|nr:hypothetical protein [Deltaproteobacteria bacterium]